MILAYCIIEAASNCSQRRALAPTGRHGHSVRLNGSNPSSYINITADLTVQSIIGGQILTANLVAALV